MQRKAEASNQERKAWETPELRRLSAGSAEFGAGNVGDGGGTAGSNRS